MLLRRLAPPGRAVWLGLALAVLAPAPARAVLPPASSETLLSTCPDARSLRAALTRLADSTRATSASAIGDVHYWRGVSYSRGGIPDSALADFRRAADVRGDPADQIALADALIARSAPGDLEAVAARMEQASAGGLSEDVHSLRARLGWALFLEGRADSAMRVFEPMRADLDRNPAWHERLARVVAAAHPGDARQAFGALFPIAVASHGANRDVLDSLGAALARDPEARSVDLATVLRGAIARADAAERMGVESRGGRLMRWTASDHFPISAALFAGARREPVVVMLLDSPDSLAGCDSLVAALRSAGFAALLVERRGSRGASGPGCTRPFDFYGREDALEARIALDALEALRLAAREVPLDTTRVVLGGVGHAAPTAVLAAARLAKPFALLLVSPEPLPIQLGPTRARLAKLLIPMYLQLSAADFDVVLTADALYQSGLRPRSFVAESGAPQHGAEQFRGDPAIRPRLAGWLARTLKAPPAPATPRSAPRKG